MKVTPGVLIGLIPLSVVVGCGGGSDVIETTGSSSTATKPMRELVLSNGPNGPVRECATLLLASFQDGSKVTSATEVPAAGDIPRHCLVSLLVPNQINIVIGLPVETWNGRYQAAGNGGFAGVMLPSNLLNGLKNGYATSMTDTGHVGAIVNGNWAWTPTGPNYSAINDFVYRANHEMAVKAKSLIKEYYGREQNYSYWNGCSDGGREGVTAAVRYPNDFDGVVVGAPALDWAKFLPGIGWPQIVMKEEQNFIPSCKTAALEKLVAEVCDKTDGIEDGLFDHRCNIKATDLLGKDTPCGSITSADATVLQKVWDGPRHPDGSFLWYGQQPGSAPVNETLETTGLTTGPIGIALDGKPNLLFTEWMKWWVAKDPLWDWHSMTYYGYAIAHDRSVNEWSNLFVSGDTADLSAFRAAGGKLLVWHGLKDPLIPTRGSINFYESLLKRYGTNPTRDFARFFLVPNVQHCGGGDGPAPKDPLGTLVQWREGGNAPDTLLTSLPAQTGVNKTDAEMTRNACAYPKVPVYSGSGSIYEASSFRCEVLKTK